MAANGGSRITPDGFVKIHSKENPIAHHSGTQYVPAPQESVIGVIIQKVGEGFRVDIGSAHYASLDGLAFESATKRNKPNLKVPCILLMGY